MSTFLLPLSDYLWIHALYLSACLPASICRNLLYTCLTTSPCLSAELSSTCLPLSDYQWDSALYLSICLPVTSYMNLLNTVPVLLPLHDYLQTLTLRYLSTSQWLRQDSPFYPFTKLSVAMRRALLSTCLPTSHWPSASCQLVCLYETTSMTLLTGCPPTSRWLSAGLSCLPGCLLISQCLLADLSCLHIYLVVCLFKEKTITQQSVKVHAVSWMKISPLSLWAECPP